MLVAMVSLGREVEVWTEGNGLNQALLPQGRDVVSDCPQGMDRFSLVFEMAQDVLTGSQDDPISPVVHPQEV